MDVLVPIDGSDCSDRALRFAIEFAERYGGSVQVVHVTDHRTEATEKLLEEAEAVLSEEGVPDDVEVYVDMATFQRASAIGKDILQLVREEDYDHVVMGHHGTGAVGRAILGSASETVVRGTEVPVTVVP